MSAKPIIKWAGGKRQLLDKLIEHMPNNFKTYYEPFIGGGALFFEIMPHNSVINDVNEELLSIYKCLSNDDDFELMLNDLKEHEKNHSEEYYYKIREMDRDANFKELPIWKRAARAIYLNKSCFNGLYRVNSHGYFNVPSGKKEKVQTYDIDNLLKIHKYFKQNNIKILAGDFVDAVKTATAGDFVYFDPPYDSFDEKESFTSYTKNDFSKNDSFFIASSDAYIFS